MKKRLKKILKNKNFINKLLDKKYNWIELFYMFFFLLGLNYIFGLVFGYRIKGYIGFMFITFGLYGFIRSYLLKSVL